MVTPEQRAEKVLPNFVGSRLELIEHFRAAMAEARAEALREATNAVAKEYKAWNGAGGADSHTDARRTGAQAACRSIDDRIRKLTGGAT